MISDESIGIPKGVLPPAITHGSAARNWKSKRCIGKGTSSLYLWGWTTRNAPNAAKRRVLAAPGSAIFVKDLALPELPNVKFFPALRAGFKAWFLGRSLF